MSLPDRVGRLRRVARVGAGAFATVWLYHDDDLDSPVAVKALADNWAQRSDVCDRFVEEARILRRVDADHVVRVYDIGAVDATPYFVMTYADRGTVADLVADGRPVPAARAVDVIAQAGAGVAALHRAGVIHRDLKPQNLLLASRADGSEQVLVADLGLAKAMAHASGLTQVVGTPAYMAPEQGRGEGLDLRADVHALGAVAYQLLTGRLVRDGGLASLAAPETPPAPSCVADVPSSFDPVLLRALAPDPADRWPDVPSFVAALRSAHEAGAPATPGAAAAPRRRGGLRLALLALVVLAVAVAFGAGAGVSRFVGDDVTPARAGASSSATGAASDDGDLADPAAGAAGAGSGAAPSPDLDFPPLRLPAAQTWAEHRLVLDGRSWRYAVPSGWVPTAVAADSGDAGTIAPGDVDAQSQVRWRPPGEPLIGGYSLRLRLMPLPDDPGAPSTASPSPGGIPIGATVLDAVAAKKAALLGSRDLDDVDVYRTGSDELFLRYRDGLGRTRYNFFLWIGGTGGTGGAAELEVSVAGRTADRDGLEELLEELGSRTGALG